MFGGFKGLDGFWANFKKLPRSRRIGLGLVGMVVGWYGPSVTTYLFVEPGILKINHQNNLRFKPEK